jgi:hypothetical protein
MKGKGKREIAQHVIRTKETREKLRLTIITNKCKSYNDMDINLNFFLYFSIEIDDSQYSSLSNSHSLSLPTAFSSSG